MNIDYAVCQALNHKMTGLCEALIEYDVACQWAIHFCERIAKSRCMFLPNGMVFIPGVGKFHLGTHIIKCFYKHSLNFIHSAGQQDGEILETLWASLNKVAGSIRAMSKPHRQEMLDDHICDSNWKKLVNISNFSVSHVHAVHHLHEIMQLTHSQRSTRKCCKAGKTVNEYLRG